MRFFKWLFGLFGAADKSTAPQLPTTPVGITEIDIDAANLAELIDVSALLGNEIDRIRLRRKAIQDRIHRLHAARDAFAAEKN